MPVSMTGRASGYPQISDVNPHDRVNRVSLLVAAPVVARSAPERPITVHNQPLLTPIGTGRRRVYKCEYKSTDLLNRVVRC